MATAMSSFHASTTCFFVVALKIALLKLLTFPANGFPGPPLYWPLTNRPVESRPSLAGASAIELAVWKIVGIAGFANY